MFLVTCIYTSPAGLHNFDLHQDPGSLTITQAARAENHIVLHYGVFEINHVHVPLACHYCVTIVIAFLRF